ncbi:adenylyl-sulfate kinase [Pedobacter yulinensis]|nr:adenylyl-sulfate kinase [Pedobacter yulinensis]
MFLQFTGRSGAGKTTLAMRVCALLERRQIACQVIDGDVYRQTLCNDLGFSAADRAENIRRLGQLAAQISATGQVAILCAINPFDQGRQALEARYNALTIWIDCSLPVLIKRDTKGLYRRALLPLADPLHIADLLGPGDLYENPRQAALHIRTDHCSIAEAAQQITAFILAARQQPAAVPVHGIH